MVKGADVADDTTCSALAICETEAAHAKHPSAGHSEAIEPISLERGELISRDLQDIAPADLARPPPAAPHPDVRQAQPAENMPPADQRECPHPSDTTSPSLLPTPPDCLLLNRGVFSSCHPSQQLGPAQISTRPTAQPTAQLPSLTSVVSSSRTGLPPHGSLPSLSDVISGPDHHMVDGTTHPSPSPRHVPHAPTKIFMSEDVERNRMLRSVSYHHLDRTLAMDRKRCERALEHFNDALKIDSAIGDEEAQNLLWRVLDPSRDPLSHYASYPKERGDLSQDVVVERGFSCSYGYNLILELGVYVDRDVFIDDAASVSIGARSWIGHGARILTSLPILRSGHATTTNVTRLAMAVIIEAEVVLGQGVVIYPGVTLARGTVVEPASVIKATPSV